MIHAIFFHNIRDATRLSKWYRNYLPSEKQQIESEIHLIITQRQHKWTHAFPYRDLKGVCRQYASVVMCILANVDDNEHCLYDLMHLIIQILDEHFGNVREMDIVVRFDVFHAILNELVLAGDVVEVSKDVVLQSIRHFV
ncbi:bifunctional AP complex [Babesia duncani]|uniref:AP complex subunit sigma n=1 Tax=Babesia duncani TaxID=323732 RepID=A0AAD9PLD8_9APIC|nr:bifunctional AP complex [Babesia duncani]